MEGASPSCQKYPNECGHLGLPWARPQAECRAFGWRLRAALAWMEVALVAWVKVQARTLAFPAVAGEEEEVEFLEQMQRSPLLRQ